MGHGAQLGRLHRLGQTETSPTCIATEAAAALGWEGYTYYANWIRDPLFSISDRAEVKGRLSESDGDSVLPECGPGRSFLSQRNSGLIPDMRDDGADQ